VVKGSLTGIVEAVEACGILAEQWICITTSRTRVVKALWLRDHQSEIFKASYDWQCFSRVIRCVPAANTML